MNKPIIKNIILIGIPTIISTIGIIMALDKFKNYNYIFIFITLILFLFFLFSLLYYSKQETNNKNEIDELKTTILTIRKVMGINSKTISSVVKLLDSWNGDINKIANDISKNGYAKESDWNRDKIYNDICVCCKDSISEFTQLDDDTDISVSLVKYYQQNDLEYVKMVAHSSPQTARPDIFDKELLLSECDYYFGRLIKENNRDIKALENNNEIKNVFYKPKLDTDLNKYKQYIAIPIICSKNKILGMLQVTTKYNYEIMSSKVDLIKFGETYLTPFVELLILTEKIEKGIFAKPNE